MPLSASSLETYHRQQLAVRDEVVFPAAVSFVYAAFLNSLLQAAVNAVFLLAVTISTSLWCVVVALDVWRFGFSRFTLSLLPFAIWMDFLFTFLVLFLLSTEDRILQHSQLRDSAAGVVSAPPRYVSFILSLAKPAYFRLRGVALYRLASPSPYYRYRFDHWYAAGELRLLCLLDVVSALIVYLPAYQGAASLASAEGDRGGDRGGAVRLLMTLVAAVCMAAFALAQLTWMLRLAEAAVGCSRGREREAPQQQRDEWQQQQREDDAGGREGWPNLGLPESAASAVPSRSVAAAVPAQQPSLSDCCAEAERERHHSFERDDDDKTVMLRVNLLQPHSPPL